MHYVTEDHNDKDNDRDKQLPFKSPDSSAANTTFVSLPDKLMHFSFQSYGIKKNEFQNTNDFFEIVNFHTLVWHPPQVI